MDLHAQNSNFLNNFSHRVHQLPNFLSDSEYMVMVVAYKWMQNEERVLKNCIFIISVCENLEINAKKGENASCGVKN